jgi:hypothetical protein
VHRGGNDRTIRRAVGHGSLDHRRRGPFDRFASSERRIAHRETELKQILDEAKADKAVTGGAMSHM